jgi:hypothetical protein
VDSGIVDRGVTETDGPLFCESVQVVEDKAFDRQGHVERALVAGVYPGVDECVADEG